MDRKLLQILACPECKKEVRLHWDKVSLICGTCGLIFPIRDGIPVMLGEKVEERALDFYNFPDDQRYGREEHGDVRELVEDLIKRYLKNFSGDVVVELGCGKGVSYISKVHSLKTKNILFFYNYLDVNNLLIKD